MSAVVVMEDNALAPVHQESLLTLGVPSEMTTEQLVAAAIQAFAKIRPYIPYIVELRQRFEGADRDERNQLREPIAGCHTWKEFCKSILNRSPQTVWEACREKKPKLETHEVTEAEFAGYEHENQGIRKLTEKLLADGLPESDVVSALVNMEHPKEMAEAAVRIVTGVKSEEPAPAPPPPNPPNTPKSLQDVQLEVCSRTDSRYEAYRDKHYIPNHGCIGQQVHFLIHYKGELAGIISGASAAYATEPRDQFFGINKENRQGLLQGGVVDNNVFHLANHEPNLATRVLRMWREVIPHIWYELYGTVVYGFETFVIENDTRKGALYKADNWTLAGTTSGATKVRNGIENPADNWKQVEPKLVFCKWRDGFTTPCSSRTSEWGRQLGGECLWSSQPPLPPMPDTSSLLRHLLCPLLHSRSYADNDGNTVFVIGSREDISQIDDYSEVEFVFSESSRLIHIGVLNTRPSVVVNDVEAARSKQSEPSPTEEVIA